jgi:hypothetical protein
LIIQGAKLLFIYRFTYREYTYVSVMIIHGVKLLFIYCFTYTEYTYVSPTDYDYTVIYKMINKSVTVY